MIGAFLSRTTCESLVHKLGRKGPQTTKELLDIATSHASEEEVVRAIFDHLDGKARRDKGVGDVRELIALSGEASDVPAEGLTGLLIVVLEVPWVSRALVCALEVPHKDL